MDTPRPAPADAWRLVIGYAAAFCLAGLAGGFDPRVGLVLKALLMLVATNHYIFAAPARRDAFLPAVIVASLLGLIAVGLPLRTASPALRVAAVGGPVLVGAVLAARLTGDVRRFLVVPGSWRIQLLVGASGLPLAGVVWTALGSQRDQLSVRASTPLAIVTAVAVLIVFGALVEEVVFRGLVQDAARQASPRAAVLVSTAMFVASYAGAQPFAYLAAVATTGFLLALARERTGSLVGAVIAHAVINVCVLIVGPRWP